jgi:hypothetical protein
VSVTQLDGTAVAARFLDALQRRDFEDIGSCFHTDARLRALVPSRLREEEGVDAIVERFKAWVGSLEGYEVADAGAEELADLVRIRYSVRGTDPEVGYPTIFEQTAYAAASDGAFTEMRLVCSGDRPLAPA